MSTLEVAVVIDRRNLPIFEKHLSAAGYVIEQRDGVTADTLVLAVTVDSLVDFNEVVHTANAEAAA